MKVCSSCHAEKECTEFWKRRASKDGLQNVCISCTQGRKSSVPADVRRQQGQVWRDNNRERVNLYAARRRAKDPVRSAAEAKSWLGDHKELLAERKRVRRAEDPEHCRAVAKARRDKNPEQHRAHNRTRRARVANALATLTPEQWAAIVEFFEGRCAYCNEHDRPITQDHVKPLSRGGQHAPDNVVPACKPCNTSKGARTPEEWGRRVNSPSLGSDTVDSIVAATEIGPSTVTTSVT
jgi:5-methylcytosine-specific restriction endonuclease McrA